MPVASHELNWQNELEATDCRTGSMQRWFGTWYPSPAHLAATTQSTPVIGLYAHSDPRRTGPYNDLDIVVSVYQQHVEAQQGKPVEDLPWGTRAKGDDLTKDITLDMVKQQLDKVLNSSQTLSKDS